MKNIKKLLTALLIIPTLLSPVFATVPEDVILQNDEINTRDVSEKSSLGEKIRSIEEVSAGETNSPKKQIENYSPWAIKELNEVQFMGIFPIERLNPDENFKSPATIEDLNTVFKLSKEKLAQAGIETGNFEFKNTTRLETLKSISALLKDEHKIKNLQDKKIFRGLVDDDYLNTDIPLQEMLALYKRAVSNKLEKENLTSKGFFYEVKNKNNTVYMLGSVHVGATKMYPVSREILNSLKKSSKIYMEIDLTKKDEIEAANKKAYYDEEGLLKEDLGEDLYNRVVKIFENNGVPEENIKSLDLGQFTTIFQTIPTSPLLTQLMALSPTFCHKL
jgi:hypothetical protein